MFLNIKNVQSNYIYAEKVIKENMICYFCETWLSELDKRFLDEHRLHFIKRRLLSMCFFKCFKYWSILL
jgi:hypothetical protein